MTIFRQKLLLTSRGPSLQDFITRNNLKSSPSDFITNGNQTYYIKTYGCQMNENDTEVFNSIMKSNRYQRVEQMDNADYIFLMTCAIRENAESKIWQKIQGLKKQKKKIGILGCMAENVKEKLLKEVDIIAGPDAYKSVPTLIAALEMNPAVTGIGNVQLSAEETYADITPLRRDKSSTSAYISIIRGCNNMCSFCIVPFTRGIERSRPSQSIIDEVKRLRDEGIKEITLLGQNVNSYIDTTEKSNRSHIMSGGFRSIYSPKPGYRFFDLLDEASRAAPSIRFRFTSPHPKDFPMDLLHLIKERNNICKNIHLPLQSGSTSILKDMRRFYSKESYLDLADTIRKLMPDCSISTDIIVGFCGESDSNFNDTLEVVEKVKFESAYMFIYSMRPKTHAYHKFTDNVSEEVKKERLQRLVQLHHKNAKYSLSRFVGKQQQVIVEGEGRKPNQYKGRTDLNISTHFYSSKPIATGTMLAVRITGNSSVSFDSEIVNLKKETSEFAIFP
eukprot:NODE_184_length_13742_cov_0.550539.p2 type:complete len:503 gc:universal NODE_184_length_13742_cov_0.550539:1419-2927(+)